MTRLVALIVFLVASIASAQTVDRDMTMIEPTTSAGGQPLTNLKSCTVGVVDSSAGEVRVITASAPTGGGTHTIDLNGKTGLTTVTAKCQDTLDQEGASVSLTRTFPGDPPASPTLRP